MPVAGADFEYRPFPNEQARNWRQESIEVPLVLAALGVPRGARVLEVGCGAVRALPFPDASFDVVIDFGTTYHIGRPLDALREISRVLALGGRFCHETPLAQALSHPVRWGGRTLPWSQVPELRHGRRALLWSCRLRAAGAAH